MTPFGAGGEFPGSSGGGGGGGGGGGNPFTMLELIQQNGDTIPDYPTGPPDTITLAYLGPDNFGTGGQYILIAIGHDDAGNANAFINIATSPDGTTWTVGSTTILTQFLCSLQLFNSLLNVTDYAQYFPAGSGITIEGTPTLTIPPTTVPATSPVVTMVGTSVGSNGYVPAVALSGSVTVTVTNDDGTESIVINCAFTCAASSSVDLDWTTATVVSTEGSDLSYDGTSAINSAAGGTYSVVLTSFITAE